MSVTSPVTSRVTSPVVSRVTDGRRRRRATGINIASLLFGAGEVGVWYDPSDITTLFQDEAGTTPVTASGQTVRRILDKSGNGFHAYQADAAKAPAYTVAGGLSYLLFDGIDDFLETDAIDFTGGDKMTVFAGVRKLSNTIGLLLEYSPESNSNNGAFAFIMPSSNGVSDYRFRSRGSTTQNGTSPPGIYAPPISNVITGIGDISGDVVRIRVNGVQDGENTGDQGTGNYGNHKAFIGMRAGTSLPFNGQIYGLIVRAATTDLDTIALVEAELATKTGVTL